MTVSVATDTPALDELARYLRTYLSWYTIDDLAPSRTPGYLQVLVPCPHAGKHWLCGAREHYHSVSVGHWPHGFGRGHGRGAYAWWRALQSEYAARGVGAHQSANCFDKPQPV
jgi:hypothetical protein